MTERISTERVLDWDGGFNVRDLGGLPLRTGARTRCGQVVRAGDPSGLSDLGWAAALAHGVATVVDLTEPADVTAPDATAGSATRRHPRPDGITTVSAPLDDETDTEFWAPLIESGHWGTALYYRAFLDRFPARVAAAMSAVAAAGPGAVLIHCARGRDRTGLISLLLLAVADVDPSAIADDYDISNAEVTRHRLVALGHPDDGEAVLAVTDRAGVTNNNAIRAVLADVDVPAYLLSAGLSVADLASIRERLVGAQ